STIANNQSGGKALYTTGGTTTITNNTISGEYGIYMSDASPTVTNNTISNSSVGIYATNNSNPVVTNNRIYSNTSYGLNNTSNAVTINAESNWWGDASGPYHAVDNPTGLGNKVSNYVDVNPWLTTDPALGDITPPANVTLGTITKDVWNKTISLNWTNPGDADFDHIRIDRTSPTGTETMADDETGTSYSDTTPNYTIIYTYTLYVVDTSNNSSSGVVTPNQKLKNPAPTNLTLTPGDTTIIASWVASSAPANTLGGYTIYYGTNADNLNQSIDVNKTETSTTITGLINGRKHYVAVSASNKAGVESTRTPVKSARPNL
ncbi:MAG: fibronectin type III domain-containing protein, partial [Candidatus Kerfeldbacteria bacterium]|nr:fibronectin type III domain-containing protein [Candidatus Kerfeldbacteria bacterium]